MEEFHDPNDKTFVSEQVNSIIKESIESTIQNNLYHHQKVGQWNSNIIEQCLKKLSLLNKPYKYITTCLIFQRNGAGLHCANSSYWDNQTDGSATYKYENKSMYIIVNVYGLAV